MARWVGWVVAGLFGVAVVEVAWSTYAAPRNAKLTPVIADRQAAGELPIKRISFRTAAAPYGTVHHLSLPGSQVWSIAGRALCVVQYPFMEADGSFTGASRIDVIDADTGHIEETIAMPRGLQANAAYITERWLVWQTGPDGGIGMRQLWAEARSTGTRFVMRSAESGVQEGDVVGLKVVGDTAYWLSVQQMKNDVQTTVWAYDLATRKGRRVLTEDSQRDGRAVLSMAVGERALWFVEAISKNPFDPSAPAPAHLVRISLSPGLSNRTAVPLWHPGTLYAATDEIAILQLNANPKPNSPDNPAPYPVFAYRLGASVLEQWTDRQAGMANGDATWLTVDQSDAGGGRALLLHRSSQTETVLPAPFAYTDGHWVAWWDGAGHLAWAALT